MALADLFPPDLINTTNLTFRRFTTTTTWTDDSGAASLVAGPMSAVIMEGLKLRRGINNEDQAVTSTLLVPADAQGITLVRVGDRASWSGLLGSRSNEEILAIDRISGVAGLEHYRLSIRERAGGIV